ncbi:MAG: ATP-binding cassette domain-containing protein, partial [Gemmatimonadales bacterium]
MSDSISVTPSLALELQQISKHFGRVEALSRVSLQVQRGSVHALLGENGAGKTTLMRIAFGMIRADGGEIRVDGVRRELRSPADAITAGIGMVHQHFMLAPAMTVAENVELGGRGKYSARAAANTIRRLGEQTGLLLDPSARVSTLGVAAQQRLEIIKALAHNARILILDEPTAVLAPAEVRDLFAQVRKLALDGTSVVLITHKLRDAQQYADDVTVLRHGKLVLQGSMKNHTDTSLAEAMLGKHPAFITDSSAATSSTGDPIISLENVGVVQQNDVRRLRGVNIQIRAGEIVGIAALDGNATHLLRILAGRSKPTEGIAKIPTHVGFVPEDRLRDALVPGFSLYENVALLESGRRKGRMPWSRIRRDTLTLLDSFDIRTADIDMTAQTLSGGNQQKLVLARELS